MKKSIAHRLMAVLVLAGLTMMLSACSSPPDDIIQGAIINNHESLKLHIYELKDFEVKNSYERTIGDESATVIEYTGETKLVNHNIQMGFGITYAESQNIQGTVVLVKRGNSWYSL